MTFNIKPEVVKVFVSSINQSLITMLPSQVFGEKQKRADHSKSLSAFTFNSSYLNIVHLIYFTLALALNLFRENRS